jgi:hypothetical protein
MGYTVREDLSRDNPDHRQGRVIRLRERIFSSEKAVVPTTKVQWIYPRCFDDSAQYHYFPISMCLGGLLKKLSKKTTLRNCHSLKKR